MPNDDFIDSLRLTDARRVQVLNSLDASTPASTRDKSGKSKEIRSDKRHEFRSPDIPISIEHPGGGHARILVCARNISAGGLSCLHGGFLHKGSKCSVRLRTLDGEQIAVNGIIASCRHVDGAIHEIGIKFDRRIEPEMFVELSSQNTGADSIQPSNLRGRVFYLDPSDADRKLVAHLVKQTAIQFADAASPTDALAAIQQRKIDILLTEILIEGLDGAQLIQQLREAGFTGPIAIITSETSDERLAAAVAAGASTVLNKPYGPPDLLALLGQLHRAAGAVFDERSIYSDLQNQPGMADLLKDYINQAHQNALKLEQAIANNQLDVVRFLCLTIKGSAGNHGFKALASTADSAIRALDASASITKAATQLRSLALLCNSVTVR